MAERKLKVFLCHSSDDKPAVRGLYQRLLVDGFDPWLDKEALKPGKRWKREISRAIRDTDVIVVCLSQSSVTKEGYVQKEIGEALDVAEEKPEDVIFLIPLQLENCPIPDRLSQWHAATLYERDGYEKLIDALAERAESLGLTIASNVIIPPLSPALAPTFRNSIGMEFILIPAGEFQMGSEDGRDNEKPVHLVRITKPFYLGTYQVTQEQWQAVMGNNPSRFTGDPNRPVEMVSWEDAHVFLQRLNEREKGKGHRLPTEAEWEYAARAGSTGAYCFGDDVNQLQEYAWYEANAQGTTHPVGQRQPNAWGFYDMHGNVFEWCHDGLRTYTSASVSDPLGPTTKDADRVFRGGRWGRDARGVRYDGLGFRCASSM